MIKVTIGPNEEPVSLSEAKLHSRIDHNDEDALINTLITAARQLSETFTGRAFCTQTVEYRLDRWPSGRAIYLPVPPVQTINSVVYLDADGNPETLTAGTDYIADTDSPLARVVLPKSKSWPTAQMYEVNPIIIQFETGVAAADVPASVKAAMKLIVGSWYENREHVLPAGHVGKQLPDGVSALLWQNRSFWTPELNK